MLALYAKGVKAMMAKGADDPTSWTFQWYIHAVRNDTTKAAEITRVFGSASSPHRTLATDTWSTCQAHFEPANYAWFLPWHRMFLYYFESIVRDACGDSSFTLPYWNYSDVNQRSLPEQFRMQTDPTYATLYVDKRKPSVNAGDPIDKGTTNDPLSTASLKKTDYLKGGVDNGFCFDLDRTLHGAVHVGVGGPKNMGTIPWAAYDPIFWIHHCNIDRLWASWNAAGRSNPSTTAWLNQTFNFSDKSGTEVSAKVGDFVGTTALGYEYDKLEPVTLSVAASGAPEILMKSTLGDDTVEDTAGPATLGSTPIEVKLVPTSEKQGLRLDTLRGSDARTYLVLDGRTTDIEPGILYAVYLNLPQGMSGAAASAYYVGTFNFFDVMPGMPMENQLSFDVTDVVNALLAQGPVDGLTITIAPEGTPATGATPVVTGFELVLQQ
jgi:tyrosinase